MQKLWDKWALPALGIILVGIIAVSIWSSR